MRSSMSSWPKSSARPGSGWLRLQAAAAALSPSSQPATMSALYFTAGAAFPLLAAWFIAGYVSRGLLLPPSDHEAAPPLPILSLATASGTVPPLPLLLAHNSHMFAGGERGILQWFDIGWKWHFNDAIPWNGIVVKPTLGSGRMSTFSYAVWSFVRCHISHLILQY
uniref:Uncharacterized protein n=1 Tax=Oryza glumipatula TaxID=40148 RepID=A0A0E0BR50_9ORYZ